VNDEYLPLSTSDLIRRRSDVVLPANMGPTKRWISPDDEWEWEWEWEEPTPKEEAIWINLNLNLKGNLERRGFVCWLG